MKVYYVDGKRIYAVDRARPKMNMNQHFSKPGRPKQK